MTSETITLIAISRCPYRPSLLWYLALHKLRPQHAIVRKDLHSRRCAISIPVNFQNSWIILLHTIYLLHTKIGKTSCTRRDYYYPVCTGNGIAWPSCSGTAYKYWTSWIKPIGSLVSIAWGKIQSNDSGFALRNVLTFSVWVFSMAGWTNRWKNTYYSPQSHSI